MLAETGILKNNEVESRITHFQYNFFLAFFGNKSPTLLLSLGINFRKIVKILKQEALEIVRHQRPIVPRVKQIFLMESFWKLDVINFGTIKINTAYEVNKIVLFLSNSVFFSER